jgi:hypothetical protein
MTLLRAIQPDGISIVDHHTEHLVRLRLILSDREETRVDGPHVALAGERYTWLVPGSLGDGVVLGVEFEDDGVACFGFDGVGVEGETAAADFDFVLGCEGEEGEEAGEDDEGDHACSYVGSQVQLKVTVMVN